ncbi:transmembrane and coiled-coil domains protein 2 isoform X2 [Musca domestica]|uniref:Transmembrane and coiled-coil domains protein 2 isoform X2 n=1 Tax=Musca domestica TaxID=7370 RepID=A0ABM3V0E2_MUSDO|nr:transmembrane and coiled-coil domains protein 2 isoform X2 [Musca domestica]
MNTTTVSREREHHRGESADSTGSATIGFGGSSSAAVVGGIAATSSGASNSVATTMTGSMGSGGGVGVVGVTPYRGFRSHSPTNRRSRERNRTHARTHGSDQGGLLAYGAMGGGIPLSGVGLVGGDVDVALGSTGITSGGVIDDTRLSGLDDICYQSFASDDLDAAGGPGHGGETSSGSKKHHRRHERTSSLQALDRLNTKIQCTKESIRKEQTSRDDNVNEYLKLAASADKQQLIRIKAVFEKKNQKSAHSISQLQKKLDNYTKRVKDLQNQQYQHKSQHRQPREVLRDVGQGLRNVGGNIRDGITGFSGSVMSKPREFAHLIKNKFGSADNINQMSESELNNLNMPANHEMFGSSTPNTAIPNASTGSGGGGGMLNAGGAGSGKFNSENGSECSSVTSESIPAGSGKSQSGASQYHIVLKSLLTELAERKAEIEKLTERVERLENAQKDFNNLTATLEGERYRAESLEEQINDLTELHQNEIENLKQTIADMEEKVQYQSDERLQDVNEVLENCQTRISKMEHLSQQQYVTVEGIDNSNARALVVKLINVVLTILQVVLLLVATAAGIIMPFLKTRVRVLTTFLSIFVIICVIRQWPDVQDIGAGLLRHLKQSLVVK